MNTSILIMNIISYLNIYTEDTMAWHSEYKLKFIDMQCVDKSKLVENKV